MIEQPLWSDDFYFHARLQKQIADGDLPGRSHPQRARRRGRAGTGRLPHHQHQGGPRGRLLARRSRVHDVAAALSTSRSGAEACWSRASAAPTMWHSRPCRTSRLPGDVSASKRYWKEDIIEPEVEVSRQGLINVPDSPGCGYRVREDLIERLTVRKETFRADR